MKNNLKIIITFIIGVILTASISVYAAIKYQASEIEYNNTPLNEVLNDLYDKADNNFSFGSASYVEELTTVNNNQNEQNTKLNKGKYIISFVRTRSYVRNGTNEWTRNSDYELLCKNNNCSITELSNREYSKTGTTATTAGNITIICANNLYYVDVLEDNEIIYVNYTESTTNTNFPDVITMHIIPIN